MTVPLRITHQDGASTADYSEVPTEITFNAGDTSKSFDFSATNDTIDDDDESVKLTFGTLPAGVSEGSPSETTVSITDDDDPAVTVSFGASTYTAAEGGTATVTVTLSADPERTVEVRITATNQGGASAADYSLSATSLTFGPTETEQTFTFTAAQDSVDDDGESVKLTFGSALPAGVSRGSVPETTVSINDDDDPAVEVSFELSSYSVAEGETETVKVTLGAAPERTVIITLVPTNQGGASDSDYSGVPASVVFASGETERSIIFSATQDTIDDDGESVRLGFGSTLPDRVSAGATSETVVSITDDDVPSVAVSFGSAAYTVAEGGTVEVTVTLSADPERTVIIPLTVTNQDGATTGDYSVPNSITVLAGQTSQTIIFTATDDTEDDDDESVLMAFGTLPDRVTPGSINQATVMITDNDDPEVTVSFGKPAYTVTEDESPANHSHPERRPGANCRDTPHGNGPRQRNLQRLLRGADESDLQRGRNIKILHLHGNPGRCRRRRGERAARLWRTPGTGDRWNDGHGEHRRRRRSRNLGLHGIAAHQRGQLRHLHHRAGQRAHRQCDHHHQ